MSIEITEYGLLDRQRLQRESLFSVFKAFTQATLLLRPPKNKARVSVPIYYLQHMNRLLIARCGDTLLSTDLGASSVRATPSREGIRQIDSLGLCKTGDTSPQPNDVTNFGYFLFSKNQIQIKNQRRCRTSGNKKRAAEQPKKFSVWQC
jgi:hypothetical protein